MTTSSSEKRTHKRKAKPKPKARRGRKSGVPNKATAGIKAAFRKCEKALNWQRATCW